jgi:hypothetical protein
MITPLQIQSVEPSLIMYAFGLIFGILSVLYFAKDILVSLSITTKNYSLFLIAFLIFTSSLFTQSVVFQVIIITISAVAYSIAVVYTWKKNDLSRTTRFSILVVSSVLFLLVATGTQNSIFRDYIEVFVVLDVLSSAVFILLSILDIKEPQPVKYKLNLTDGEIENQQIEIGEITVSNEGNFNRSFEIPSIKCKYSDSSREHKVRTFLENKNNSISTIPRDSTKNYNIRADIRSLKDPSKDINIDDLSKIRIKDPSKEKDHTLNSGDDITVVLSRSDSED